MYGWIVDGISSLFEPVSDQNHTEWPGNSAQVPGRSAVTPGTRPESHARPAKRNYQSEFPNFVYFSDVVLSFVKKAVAGVAGLLRRNPQNKNCERYRRYEESKVGHYHISLAPLLWTEPLLHSRCHRARGKGVRRLFLDLCLSFRCLQLHAQSPDCFVNNSLSCVDCSSQAMKQNDKEHYRRLLEMLGTEKCSKSQPLTCSRTTPQKHPSDTDLSTEVATRLHLVDPALTQQSDQPPTRTNLTRHADEDLPRLTRDMAEEVSAALNQADPSLVLSAAFKLRITQRDLATLREGNWLNDEVINFYLSLVMERSSSQAAPGPRVYCFSTFFLPKLRGGEGGQAGGHWAVRRWTKAVDLFLHDLILVPLHLDVHWAMAVIDLRSQSVKSYDSMVYIAILLKKGKDLDTSRWTVGSIRACEIPQQKNGSDCGIFACKYADYISKGRPLDFKQCHMTLFRKIMVWEILNKKLL
uniref:SUMO specific peptidase 2 n=1 Tax=Gadus morhua TaxID=8049 RepID=A0A8C5F702_GADMO